ncbi:hypothetical protein DFS34DRAFT_690740 [Phlyctochytrium arcticum]|nr:hypothetical protein DFS34DRAFT_690740 [Phlyctochytrium arcticum]
MLLLKYIIAATAILSASAQTTSSSSGVSISRSLGKTSSPSTTSVAQTQPGTRATSEPEPTGPPSEKRVTRKLSEDFALLKDTREKMTFLPYTPEERVFVAQQRQEILNIYANVEEKLKNYGVDAIASFGDILKNAANMTNKDFSYAMAKHALSLRDRHTDFTIGGQHSRYSVGTPYDFDFVTSDDIIKNRQVVVRAVSQDPEYNAMFPPEVLAIKPGDLLDTIDGKSFRDYWISVQNMTGGANQFGGYRQALEMLRNQGTAKSTLVKVPYVALGNRECIRNAPKDRDTPPPPLPPPNPEDAKSDLPPAQIFPGRFAKYKYQATNSDIVSHTTYEAKDFAMGIIRLSSFVPGDLLEVSVFNAIRTLLNDTLSNTDGILFDVRGNPGGKIRIAESIYQWFAGVTEPVQTRAINHPTNRILFGNESLVTDEDRADRLALQKAASTDKFAKSVGLFSVEQVNMDGHAYLKPVAVLTDGLCYSACDFFCAGMQDSSAAIIFGEDLQNGAGGATVFDHMKELRSRSPTIFKPLPFEGSLGKDEKNTTIPIPGTSGMRVAIRQVVRIGRNAGKVLEDAGVEVDEVIRQTTAEFAQAQAEVFPQFEHIAMRLKQQAAKDSRSQLQFQSPFGFRYLTNFTIPFSASGFDRFEVRDSKGTLIVDQKLSSECEESSGDLIATKKPASSWNRYNILGYKGSQKMMTTKRPIVMLPDASELPEVAAGKSIANPQFVMFNHDGDAGQNVAAPKDGWQRSQDGSLSIRPTTIDTVNAEADFVFKVGKGATFNFKADVQLKTSANLATSLSIGVLRYEPKSGIISNVVSPVNESSLTDKIDFTLKNMTLFDSGFALLAISYSSPDIYQDLY